MTPWATFSGEQVVPQGNRPTPPPAMMMMMIFETDICNLSLRVDPGSPAAFKFAQRRKALHYWLVAQQLLSSNDLQPSAWVYYAPAICTPVTRFTATGLCTPTCLHRRAAADLFGRAIAVTKWVQQLGLHSSLIRWQQPTRTAFAISGLSRRAHHMGERAMGRAPLSD